MDVFNNGKGGYSFTVSYKGSFVDMINNLSLKGGKYRFEAKYGNKELKIVESKGYKNKYKEYSNINNNIFTIDNIKLKGEIAKYSLYSSNYPYEFKLPVSPNKEVQPSGKPWCAAYVGAKILSYEFSKDIRAVDILKWTYWTWYYKPNLSNLSLTKSQLIKYAKHLGSNPYYVDRSLYRGEIMEEITNYRMIYTGTYSLDNNKDTLTFSLSINSPYFFYLLHKKNTRLVVFFLP